MVTTSCSTSSLYVFTDMGLTYRLRQRICYEFVLECFCACVFFCVQDNSKLVDEI